MTGREQNLRIIRIESITNALYMAESAEEIWEALQPICLQNIKVLHDMCMELLIDKEEDN